MIIDQEEIKKLENFFFIVFEPNPLRDIVRIWVDGDELRATYKRDKFYKIISDIISPEMGQGVHLACTYYGGFFLLDRSGLRVTRLSNVSDKNVHLLANLHKDIMNAKEEGVAYYDDNFAGRVEDYLEKCNAAMPNTKTVYKDHINKKTGMVNYNVPTSGKWRPY